jgi:glucose-1-phosphate adenylyltransferase
LDELRIPPALLQQLGREPSAELYQGSMGIYLFNRQILVEALSSDEDDFGKHIIPALLQKYKVFAYIFQGYWEDIGTVRAFYEANLALTDLIPPYNFFNHLQPIYTHPRFLPASKINGATIRQAIVADGCIISDATLERAVVGIRSVIENGATIRNSVVMGADFYEDEVSPSNPGKPPLGIGRNSRIEGAIIDKNARIGDGVVITPEGKPENMDGDNFYIRDGVVVVPKNSVILTSI